MASNRAGRDLERAMARIPRILDAGRREAQREALPAIGRQAVTFIRVLIDNPYPPASEPGTPPHRRTGGLEDSYTFDLGEDYVRIGSDMASYPPDEPDAARHRDAFLEFGTSRMAPRPHFRPAMLWVRTKVGPIVAAAWEAGERRAARRLR